VTVSGNGTYTTQVGYNQPSNGSYQWDAVYNADGNNLKVSDVNNTWEQVTVADSGGGAVGAGNAATIGFWHNKNGQALINSLNGSSSSTHLAQWLATTFPNLYGAGAGPYSMVSGSTYLTNAQVAQHYNTYFFGASGQKTNAQVLAVALAVYSTTSGLSGGTMAAQYGFTVNSCGTGEATYNIGCNGAAFGAANNTVLTVDQILAYTNSQAYGGVLYGGNTTKINMANTVFTGINQTGDIV
jgi:hypothetical protein